MIPQPGDVIRLDGDYCGVRTGAKAVIDSHYWTEDLDNGPIVMAVFGASAYRGGVGFINAIEMSMTNDLSKPQPAYVSCSGGPCPFVKIADLTYEGRITQNFWRWKDIPRAGGGEPYTLEVSLWAWRGR